MKTRYVVATALAATMLGCGSSGSASSNASGGTGGASTGGASTGGSTSGGASSGGTSSGGASKGGASSGTGGSMGGSAGSAGAPPYAKVQGWITAYKAAHPGNGGKDWDINALTPAQIAADPAAQRLLALCGPGQRPVIPELAWEYGGTDHQWINPQASALVYCVYIPVSPSSDHWQYDSASDHVTADVYVLYPDQNPCKDRQGADQVMACLGDPTNIEILVDTASLNNGADAGLSLANASTDLNLILANGTKIHLYTGL